MTRRLRLSTIIGPVLAAAAVGTLAAQAAKQGKGITTISAETASYQPAAIPGVTKSVLYGSPDTGPYGAFTRFVPGFKTPLHTHSSDLRMVVLEGAYLYEVDGKQMRAGPNSYVFIPAGTPHTSAGDAREGALFFEESPGRFDLKPVSPPGGKRQ